MSNKKEYDAIIIGAGISGLVCGCYLAKVGMKVLIVEKNAKPGGYCTSFTRSGFQFDACVHSLGSLRYGGILNIILKELGIEKKIKISRCNPSDIIITPDFKINFWNDLNKTIEEFQNNFPKESINIKNFFDYLNNCGNISLSLMKSITFQTLLDKYFKDNKLKTILAFPLLVGNAGLPAKQVSAFTGSIIYKEFILDGGYYPGNSIQDLPDTFAECFKEFGGDIYFSHLVKKIKIKNKKINGVEIEKIGAISSKIVISNVDVNQTFLYLLGEEYVDKKVIEKIESMNPSLSAFILYLGSDGKLNNIPPKSTLWFLPHYNIDKICSLINKGDIENFNWFLANLSSDKKSLYIFVNTPYKDKKYWEINKKKLIDIFMEKIDFYLPNILPHIIYKDAATPNTLYKWTLNSKGATYGWAWIPSQIGIKDFMQKTYLENLYLTGHWTTLMQGVAGVAYIGRDTSKKILANLRY